MNSFGILNVNKPAGCSSRHVVDQVERIVRPAKAGHAGTLDPLATGVLVVCVGQATRLIPYVQQMPKRYRGTFLLGHCSVTDDIEGEVTQLQNVPMPTLAQIEAALPQFMGVIEQVPPAHSAVKIAGRRAYKLARAGRTVELAPRAVTIHRLAVHHYDYPQLTLDIECGSGTYVRSLGRDLAASLGTAAIMTALERSAIGHFTIGNAIPLDQISPATIAERLQPAVTAVDHLERVTLTEQEVEDIHNGRPVKAQANSRQIASSDPEAELAALDGTGELVALLRQKHPGELWPTINFFRR